ncbi:MAG: homocysteine S-methyltransferase family protein [Gammaproteobacteria bacterium]|nr:homocysteine S-methyltransferase family protein [Gammaproteobacteria bacterium]
MGQELIARAGEATPLWSVKALLDQPQLVRQVHQEFFAAGAQIATTNTYSLLPDRMIHHKLIDQFENLQRLACELAVAARDAHGSGRVAGSLGPQGFSYQPDKCPPIEQAAADYRKVCQIQVDYVDFFLAETMSSIEQVMGALEGTSGFGKPVWVALTVSDSDGSRLRSGEPVVDVLPLLPKFDVQAVLINCSVPEAVTAAVPLLSGSAIPVGAYANGFVEINTAFDSADATVDLLQSRTDLGPSAYADFAERWVADGATLIGGCCEVGPAHIAELSRRLA